MIRNLFLLLQIYLVTQQKTFADDPLVSKTYPANIECRRTPQQRRAERAQVSTENYRACYSYEIDDNNNCILMDNPVVEDMPTVSVNGSNTTLFVLETPLVSTNLYPKDVACFFVIGRKRNGYIYQYFNRALFTQDLEGYLNINEQNSIFEVIGGSCQDFFEFREKQFDNSNVLINENELVTCGKIPDPRIQFGVDVATTLTLVFKSDSQNEFEGVTLYILEIRPSSTDPSKRKKRDEEAPPGVQGVFGDTGKQGAPGEPGLNGIPGRNGLEGVKGERGIPGVVGPDGDIGLPGETGIPGDIGPTGPKGIPCRCSSLENCIPGIPGRKGSKGSRGFRGKIGPRGLRGEPGIPGPIGKPGEEGRKGNTGPNGAKGLPGPRGDQGSPGSRGLTGRPGPRGLDGCPLPDDSKLSRRIREVGHIFVTTTELYENLGTKRTMSADEFYDYIVKKSSLEKDLKPDSDESRVARNTESSTDCNDITVVSGPKGDQGVPGLPGNDGMKGKSGISGIDGTNGMAGDPGIPGAKGRKGAHGNKGPKGAKGDKGITGLPGNSGYCQCYQAKEEADANRKAILQTKIGNGIPGRPGPRGPHGENGPPGSIGETGSPGIQGRRGPKGFKGVSGVPGRTGSNGKQGEKGQLGQKGLQGPRGPPGPPGPPGCACDNLIILLDKYGFVRRDIELSSLLTRTNIGDTLSERNTSTEFFFEPNITCIRNDSGPTVIGLKGEQGLPGFPGASGDPGIPGLPGKDGVPGAKGSRGDSGLYGAEGATGMHGETGNKGVTGLDGKQGPPGNNNKCIIGKASENLIAIQCPRGCPNGLDGTVGDKGERGPKGFSGFKGYRGIRGPPGNRGVVGLSGLPGDEGKSGKPGVKGPKGLRGLPGAIGPAGPPGSPGPNRNCPEYDGVDFNTFLSATEEDIEIIQYLLNTSTSEVATKYMTKTKFPLVKELAKLIAGGYRFAKPKKFDCPPLKRPANGSIFFNKRDKSARFNCEHGYTIKGESIITCKNGKWSSWPPRCSKIKLTSS